MLARISVAALVAAMAVPALAQDVRECSSEVQLSAPGQFVGSGSFPLFRWTAEPEGTASREVVIFAADNTSRQSVGEAQPFKVRLRVPDGTFGWFVVFRDANGNPICSSAAGAFVVGRPTLPPEILAT